MMYLLGGACVALGWISFASLYDSRICPPPKEHPPKDPDSVEILGYPNPWAFSETMYADRSLTTLEVAKLFLLSPLYPIRFLLALILIAFAMLLALIGCIGLDRESLNNTHLVLPRWREQIFDVARCVGRMILRVIGVWVNIKGKLDPRARCVVSNHQSFIDSIFFSTHQYSSFLCQEKLAKAPLISVAIYAMRCVLVDRSSRKSRAYAKQLIHERITGRAVVKGSTGDAAADVDPASAGDQSGEDRFVDIGSVPPLIVYPEGACTNGRQLVQFKIGAFQPGAPVQPVVLKYSYDMVSPNLTQSHTRWKDDKREEVVYQWTSGAYMFFHLFSQLFVRLDVEYLPLYEPSTEEQADPILFAANVQSLMARRLGVPASDKTMVRRSIHVAKDIHSNGHNSTTEARDDDKASAKPTLSRRLAKFVQVW